MRTSNASVGDEANADLVGASAALVLVGVGLDADRVEGDAPELVLDEREDVRLRHDGVRVHGDVGPEVARVLFLVLALALVLARLQQELDDVAAGEGLEGQEDLHVRGRHADGEGLEVVDVGGEEHVEGGRVLEARTHERVDDACG